MRVLVVGAGGPVGRQLVPMLAVSGHDVVAMSPTPRTFCAEAPGSVLPVMANQLDPFRIARLMHDVCPDVVVNLIAPPSPVVDPKKLPREPSP